MTHKNEVTKRALANRALLGAGLLLASQCAIPEFHHPEGEDGSDLGGLGGLGGEDGASGGASSESGGTTAAGGHDTGGSDGNTGGADASGGSGEDTGGSGGTPATPCGSSGICVPPVPADWSGPVAVATAGGLNTPSCAGTNYDRTALQKVGGLDEGTPTCDCECSDPATMDCTDLHLWGHANAGSCEAIGGTDHATHADGACITGLPGSAWFTVTSGFSSGDCTPTPTVDIPEPDWTVNMVACAGDPIEGASCSGDNLCMPALQVPLAAICIYQDGEDQPCPTEGYTVPTNYYDDFTDDRSCTDCTCGDPTGTCAGSVALTNVCGSGGSVILWTEVFTTGPNATCATPSSGGSVAGTFNGPTPDGSCPPVGGEPTGTVTKTAPVTVCCMP